MAPNITAPVEGFSGKVAGVQFDDGKAHTKDANAVAYFRRHGYEVEETAAEKKAAEKAAAERAEAEAEAARLAAEQQGSGSTPPPAA